MSRRILEQLDLIGAAEADALTDRSKSFSPVHLGTRDVPIGKLLDLIHREEGLLPPRTGHLGNWQDIALGRSGPMDFNTAICGGGHGYPLIYGFNRTEADVEGGDDVYLPGSVVEHGQRRVLPLFTWNGSRYVRRDRTRPLLCALVQTELDGELIPLVEVHWQRMLSISGYHFKNWASSLLDNGPLLADMLCLLLAEAGAKGHSRRAYSDLISHAVLLDGEVGRCELRPDGHGFLLDGHRYPSARALAEAVILLLRALVEPRWFFSQLRSMPPVLPVPSLLLSNVLFGLFGDHHPGETGVPAEGPFITHLHWGARAMAGCPPRRNGYFGRKSRVRAMRAITRSLVREIPEVTPLCFVLLPAQVFMLCAPSTSPNDVESLAALFKTVLAANPDAAYETALSELGRRGDGLSDYLRGRFREASGVPCNGELLDPSVPVEPNGFRELTFRQASAVVAAFEEAYA